MSLDHYAGNRYDWEFHLPKDEVAKALQECADYHLERLAWWRNEKQIAMDDMTNGGVVWEEYNHTGGRGVEPRFNDAIKKRLSECESKIRHHYDHAAEYTIYSAALRYHEDETVVCKASDLYWLQAPKVYEEES